MTAEVHTLVEILAAIDPITVIVLLGMAACLVATVW